MDKHRVCTPSAWAKAELHCHLIGTLSPARLRWLEERGHRVLVKPDVLAQAYPVHDQASFVHWMQVLKPYQNPSLDAIRPVLEAHIHDLMDQHVVYAELMVSPTMFADDRARMMHQCEALQTWLHENVRDNIQVEFIMVIPRSLPLDRLARDTATFLALHREGFIVGVALVGPETKTSIAPLAPYLAQLKAAGLGIEIHAGEHEGAWSVKDALNHGYPDRLGHAIGAFSDPMLLERIRERNIHIEFCLTSNLKTGSVANLEEHPIRRAEALQLHYSINTDDPGAFGCTLHSEYARAAAAFGFDEDVFQRIYENTLEARFRQKLRHERPR